MRSRDKIQRAHDILVAVIVGDVPLSRNEKQRTQIMGNAEALCWILRHEHNRVFADNLAEIEKAAANMGYVLEDTGTVQMRGPDGSVDAGPDR